jgi:hypothetical protein
LDSCRATGLPTAKRPGCSWQADGAPTRQLQLLVEHRRSLLLDGFWANGPDKHGSAVDGKDEMRSCVLAVLTSPQFLAGGGRLSRQPVNP